MPVEPVTVDDPSDPRLADYVGLSDAALRREGTTFIAEGELVIRQLLRSPYPVRSVLVTPARWAALESVLAGVDAPVYVASLDVMRAVAGFNIHRGAVASATRLPLPDPLSLLAPARRVAVLEGLNDHENLGVLFRSAAAFGIDAVLLDPTCADPLYRRAVRVSLGHVLQVPFTRLSPWPSALAMVRDAGFNLVALTPRPAALPVSVLEASANDKVALLLGAEGPGLSPVALSMADRWVRIPIDPDVDSLNVGTAAAIAFHRAAGS